VFSWREQLPAPFNKPSPVIKRRVSVNNLAESGKYLRDGELVTSHKRRNSACGALDRADRRVNWERFIHEQFRKARSEQSASAFEKLKR
jgi:hypothetical protein